MAKFISNGWEVYFHPQLFDPQYQELSDRVSILHEQLPEMEFKTHATVKFSQRLLEQFKLRYLLILLQVILY